MVLTLLNVDNESKINRIPWIVLALFYLLSSLIPDSMKINDKIVNTIIAIISPPLFLFLKEIIANNGSISMKIEHIALETEYVDIMKKHNNKSITINLYICLCKFSIT